MTKRFVELDGLTVDNSTAWIHHSAGKLRTDMPPANLTGNFNGEKAVIRAAEALREYGPKGVEIRASSDWTTAGKRKAGWTPAFSLFWTIASAYSDAQAALQAADEREQRLLAVPAPDLRSPGQAIRDWEARDYFRALSPEGRLQFLAKVQQGHHDAEEILGALLNGPMARLDGDVGTIRNAWETHRREANQTEVEAIESDRGQAEWALGVISMIAVAAAEAFAGIATPLEVLSHKAQGQLPDGYGAFGITERDMRRAVELDKAAA